MAAEVIVVKHSKLAASLLRVRQGGALLGDIPAAVRPADANAAYAIADEIVAALRPSLGEVRGYKVGATSTAGQKMLGLAEPFYGRVLANNILANDSHWSHCDGCTVEAEVGFVLGRGLPARREPYKVAEVRDAVARVVPLLEINRPSYAKPFEVGGLCLIADNGVTQALVRGTPGVLIRGRSFRRETVQLTHNGREVARGTANVVLGDPLRSLVWLANALSQQQRALKQGDLVASGAMTPPIPMAAGDSVVAQYSSLGRVTLTVMGPRRK